jgi:3-oxoacyl-[acyl-carrier-protein] synthase II
MKPDVVITGVGVVSPIGIGRDAFWDSLAHGKSGVGRIDSFDTAGLPVASGGEIRDFDPKVHVKPRKSLKVMSRDMQLGFAAADLALADAGLEPGGVDPERFGMIFGADMIYDDLNETAAVFRRCCVDGRFRFDLWAEAVATELHPLWLLKRLPNMTASHAAIHHDARGPNNTIVLGDVSGLLALAEAASVIRRGWADVMLVGGAGCKITPWAMLLGGAKLLSRGRPDPAETSRPFDRDRDGAVHGEGAATVVLESAAHAARRQARVVGRLVAVAARCERRPADWMTGLSGAALTGAIRAALAAAGLGRDALGHVNAHGLSTRADDRIEAEVIRAELGDVPVTAPKSFFGTLGAGAGILELAASLVGLGHGQVPPTLNFEHADPACPVNVVHGEPSPASAGAVLKINVARTGQAAAAVVLPGD